jgi:apolipoprotein N-acyltransferase
MQISSKNYWDLLPAIAGISFTLAFSPFNYAYLAPVALGLLFASWQNVTPKRALLRGYLFGLGSFGLGVSWVYKAKITGCYCLRCLLLCGLQAVFYKR